ncbi:oxidoreductase [Escherichia coli]|nr:oxidoreductase [Escherichia coli]
MSHLKDPTTQYYTGEYPKQKQTDARHPGEDDTGTGLRRENLCW